MRRILIANRGEIALRVVRACRDLGLSPVMVHSEADRASLPVRLADAAIPLGESAGARAYLDAGAIIDAALRSGADAVHPGYGFLAENAEFAEAVARAGLVFIGPPPAAMRALGDKVEARRLMEKSGVPIIPGLTDRAADLNVIADFARQAGYPILLKAAAGGGGKGMRVVRSEGELAAALRGARSEARASFGDDGVYAEKFLEGVRHIEIQMFADGHGHAVWLGERECSLQRRHQKLIEEAPSVALTPDLRRRMGELAVQVALASGYRNAGTVEFLVDGRGQPYFMEVNARLQVEHPVTEMVTGFDLVRAQIDVAAGRPLSFRQEDVHPRGWAIECRILAEDPANGFRPHPGRIEAVRLPAGPGIRVDTALQPGDEVSLHYDALVAKLVAWGADRDEAVRRMLRALREFQIAGIRTTIPFHIEVLEGEDFRAGRFDIAWVDRSMPAIAARLQAGDDRMIAAVAAAVAAYEEARRPASGPMAGARAAGGAGGTGASRWATTGRWAQMQSRAPRNVWARGARG
jgi:acetyl-CoA carboxylase, biotin carboxylase subunit